jgi:hypothetical protein
LGVDIGIASIRVLGSPWGLLGTGSWSWFGLLFWVNGFTFISDFGIVSVLPVCGVFDNLGSTIGKKGSVFSLDNISVALSIVREVIANVILDGISEVEWCARFMLAIGVKSFSSDLFLLLILGGKVGVFRGSWLGVVVSRGGGQQSLGVDIGIASIRVLGGPWGLLGTGSWSWFGLLFWINGFTYEILTVLKLSVLKLSFQWRLFSFNYIPS